MTRMDPLRARLAEAQLALMLLTRLPAGQLPTPVPRVGASVWAFPLAGLVVGALAAASLWAGLALGLPALLAAGLALGVQIMTTGALHEDGLADVADGFWGGNDPEQRLRIMSDSQIGSYGALALILSLGLRWQAIAWLAENDNAVVATLIGVGMASRLAPLALLLILPPARPDGLGQSAGVITRLAATAAVLICLPVIAIPGMAVAVVFSTLITLGFAWMAQTKIGGQTGDALGASQQLAEIALLLGICVLGLG